MFDSIRIVKNRFHIKAKDGPENHPDKSDNLKGDIVNMVRGLVLVESSHLEIQVSVGL